jgi:hypothetical protein
MNVVDIVACIATLTVDSVIERGESSVKFNWCNKIKTYYNSGKYLSAKIL